MVNNEKKTIDGKIFDGIELSSVHISELRKNDRLYNNTYFTKTINIKLALEELKKNINPEQQYDGKNIRNIIAYLYHKL